MSESTSSDRTVAANRRNAEAEAARVLGRSFYRELRSNGYTPKELLVVCTELIDLITKDVPAPGAVPK